MIENKKFESKRYLYREADVYTPHSFRKPKLHEMGYFTNNMKAFENQKVRIVKDSYVYGELIDYNDDCERRYRSNTKWCDPYGVYDYYEKNYAFYIPESSIPKEKRNWYRKHRYNTPTYKGCFCPMVDLEKAFFSDVEDLPVEEYLYVHGDEEQ